MKKLALIAFSVLLLIPIGTHDALAFSENLNDVAGGHLGIWIVVGDNGTILRSTDNGLTWTQISSGTGVNLNSVDGNSGLFVAVGDGGKILFSNDGLSWSQMVSGTTENLNHVDSCGFVCFAVGDNGTVLRSYDGMTWSIRASGTTANLNAVGSDLGSSDIVIAVGDGGTVIRSDNFDWGDTFTPVFSGTLSDLQGVAQEHNEIIAAGYGSTTIWSNDYGLTWTELTGTDPAPSSQGDFDAVFGPFAPGHSYILANDGRIHFTFIFLDPDPSSMVSADLNGGDFHSFTEIIVGENGKMFRNDSPSPYADWQEVILNFPDEPIGGEIIPIEIVPLLLAGAQSFSWMIPVTLSILGIGIFVVSRRT